MSEKGSLSYKPNVVAKYCPIKSAHGSKVVVPIPQYVFVKSIVNLDFDDF